MSKKGTTNIFCQSLIVALMITFVVSSVFPDYAFGIQNIKIEEADMDEQESSEEKKESKEDKENLRHDIKGSMLDISVFKSRLKHAEQSPKLLELYLPVITPPPDA